MTAHVQDVRRDGDAWVFRVQADEPGHLAGVLALFMQSIPIDERQWDSTHHTWTVRHSADNVRRLAALFGNFQGASAAPPTPAVPPRPPDPQPSLFDGA